MINVTLMSGDSYEVPADKVVVIGGGPYVVEGFQGGARVLFACNVHFLRVSEGVEVEILPVPSLQR